MPDTAEPVVQFIIETHFGQLFSSAYTDVRVVQRVSNMSQAPLLKSLTLMRPSEMARNNTKSKNYSWRDGEREEKFLNPQSVNSFT